MVPCCCRGPRSCSPGGRGSRLDGVDKAGIEVGGRTLLEWALDAVIDAREVVVVGDPVPTERPVTFTRESPRYGRRPGC